MLIPVPPDNTFSLTLFTYNSSTSLSVWPKTKPNTARPVFRALFTALSDIKPHSTYRAMRCGVAFWRICKVARNARLTEAVNLIDPINECENKTHAAHDVGHR